MIDDADMLRRIDVLRQIFLDDVPPHVEAALRDIRDLRLEGDYPVHRLKRLFESAIASTRRMTKTRTVGSSPG